MAENNSTKNKYVSPSKLSLFLENLKNIFSPLTHTHTLSDLTDYAVDTTLSPTSTNPVANNVLNAEFDAISDSMNALELAIDNKADINHTHPWVQIYDSGAITEAVNSIAGINISGYSNFQIVVQNVNDGTNQSSAAGSVIFTAENGTTYMFHTWSTLFPSSSNSGAAGMAHYRLLNGWLMLEHTAYTPNATRDIFSETEGGSAVKCSAFSGGAMMRCTNELSTMAITSSTQSTSNYFGVGSRVMVWGCKA